MRALHIGDTGDDVKRLQNALNARAAARRLPGVAVDGEYGKLTDASVQRVARALGAMESTIQKPGATVGEQRLILNPALRTPAQLARAAKRKLSAVPPLRVRAYREALRDLGVRERGGNNRGPEVDKIIRENGGDLGEPWCGDAVARWYRRAGSRLVQRGWASTIWLLARLAPVRSPLQGHVVVYDFGSGGAKHTGVFERWLVVGESFTAIEGNTNATSSASDSGGGEGVHRRTRTVSQVAGFRRVAA
jgi:hypothetical protein